MACFKPLEIVQYPTFQQDTTRDTLYWKRLGFPIACKEYGSIDYVDLAEEEPHNIAVTCSSKVQIYNSTDNKVQTTLSRFKKTAYGGVFRKDSKLLVAGSDDGFVRLFEVKSSKPLRILKGHTAAVHRCHFTKSGVNVASFSDDKSVGFWDIASETRLLKLEEHKDYVRAGATSESSDVLFVSGSYDHTVKMYDTRTPSSVLSLDHGAPVESVLMFPTGGLLLSAGSTYLKVWDRVAGRLLAQVTKHHKTITSLCFASDGRRLMSASLDKHVKIYDVMTYEVVHTLDYPSPILSVACAPEDKIVVVGMADGLFSIRHQNPVKTAEERTEETRRKNVHYQYRFYGTDFKPADGDIVVPESKRGRLKAYEKYLKRFESSRALDAVLKPYIQRRHPEITVSVMMELIRRGSLRAAMAGREGPTLQPLVSFVTKYLGDPRFMRTMIDVGTILLEIYATKLGDPVTLQMFQELRKAAKEEVDYMKEMMEVLGIIKAIMAVAHSNRVVPKVLRAPNSESHSLTESVPDQEKSTEV